MSEWQWAPLHVCVCWAHTHCELPLPIFTSALSSTTNQFSNGEGLGHPRDIQNFLDRVVVSSQFYSAAWGWWTQTQAQVISSTIPGFSSAPKPGRFHLVSSVTIQGCSQWTGLWGSNCSSYPLLEHNLAIALIPRQKSTGRWCPFKDQINSGHLRVPERNVLCTHRGDSSFFRCCVGQRKTLSWYCSDNCPSLFSEHFDYKNLIFSPLFDLVSPWSPERLLQLVHGWILPCWSLAILFFYLLFLLHSLQWIVSPLPAIPGNFLLPFLFCSHIFAMMPEKRSWNNSLWTVMNKKYDTHF